MTAAKIRANALDLVTRLSRETVEKEAIPLTQALATYEVAAQLAELNKRLATSLTSPTSGPGGLTALRVFKML